MKSRPASKSTFFSQSQARIFSVQKKKKNERKKGQRQKRKIPRVLIKKTQFGTELAKHEKDEKWKKSPRVMQEK